MIIKDWPLNKIVPYEKNAKEHPKKQISQIAASIQKFGFNQPIVVDKDGVIIAGHGRYYAAQQLSIVEVPVLQIDLTEEQAKSYRLADNKLNETPWRMDLVIEELKTMSLEMIDLSGFDSNLTLETIEDRPDLSGMGEPRSKAGDLYELGPHKVICGDSEIPETYEKLLGIEKARMLFCDPPYGINYQSYGGLKEGEDMFDRTGGKIRGDDKTPSEILGFYNKVMLELHKNSTEDSTLYWWYSNRLVEASLKSIRESGWRYVQSVVWLKNRMVFSMGNCQKPFQTIYESCIVACKNGKSSYQNRTFSNFTELWTLDKKKFADYLDAWYQKRDSTNKYIHPTQKPVQLAERAIKRSSEKGDIVLDAFGGSGSTMIACDQLGRKCRMIELDPKYVDACISRYVQYKEDGHIKKNGNDIIW